jgi:hypothetical protein
MSKIVADSITNDTHLGFEPRATGTHVVRLQTQKSADRQANVITLRLGLAMLALLNPRVLFQAAMVRLDLLGYFGLICALVWRHVQATGGPVFSVAVSADCPKHFHPAIAFQMDPPTLGRNSDLTHDAIALPIGIDQAIALQPGQPSPLQVPQQLQILQSRIPTVESHPFGLKTALSSLAYHGAEVIILGQPVMIAIIDPEVTWDRGFAIRSQQRDQIDPLDDCVVFPRPMLGDQIHFLRIGLFQRRIIQHQHACCAIHQRLGLFPQRRTIRLTPVQQTRVGIMRWTFLAIQLGAGCFYGTKRVRRTDQELNIVLFVTFWWIHAVILPSLHFTA